MDGHPKRLDPADLRRGYGVALLAALVFSIFHFFGCTDVGYDARIATSSAFVWLGRRWIGELGESPLAPGPWIPLLFLLFIWSRRRELRSHAGRDSVWGLLLLILALACHWVGARSQQTRLSLGALVLILWSIPFYSAGYKVGRLLMFPCLFLFFALPLNFLDRIVWPLRGLSAGAGHSVLSGLGIEVARAGSRLLLGPDQRIVLDLADPGTGIHALIALLAVALAAGYLTRQSPGMRVVVAAAVPVAFVLGNLARVLVFGLSAVALHTTGNSLPRGSIWIQFATALLLLRLLPPLLRRARRWAFDAATSPASDGGRRV